MLVVDEAGQAQPQMALGALYRSRSAVIVGDPKQVEPVVTDDLMLLKKAYSDEALKQYKKKSLSVQGFADRLNTFGTYLDNGTDYPEWVDVLCWYIDVAFHRCMMFQMRYLTTVL